MLCCYSCEPGFWCDGVDKHACPQGRYGASYSLQTVECSGPCAAGHLCPTRYDAVTHLVTGSVSPIEHVRPVMPVVRSLQPSFMFYRPPPPRHAPKAFVFLCDCVRACVGAVSVPYIFLWVSS